MRLLLCEAWKGCDIMPVFKAGEGQAPGWSELKMFEIIEVLPGQKKDVAFRGPKERYINIKGDVTVMGKDMADEHLEHFRFIDIPEYAALSLASENGGAVMRMVGNWGDEIGGTGVFPVFKSDNPQNPGDPTRYERNASFDNHYHDCDEYWIVFSGSGRAVSEGITYDAGVGDCIATGRGYHHDFPFVHETVSAVFFETTLIGKKRIGHLWNHKDGEPEPEMGRV